MQNLLAVLLILLPAQQFVMPQSPEEVRVEYALSTPTGEDLQYLKVGSDSSITSVELELGDYLENATLKSGLVSVPERVWSISSPINLRDRKNVVIDFNGQTIECTAAPLCLDLTDSDRVTIRNLNLNITSDAIVGILIARSKPTVDSLFMVLENIRIVGGLYSELWVGAEHGMRINVWNETNKPNSAALRIASSTVQGDGSPEPLITSPFGTIAEGGTVSQWLITSINCGHTGNGQDSVGVYLGRGIGGIEFINCNIAVHSGAMAALRLNEPGGASLFNVTYSGMMEGQAPRAIYFDNNTVHSNFSQINIGGDFIVPWSERVTGHADDWTKARMP